MRRLTWHGIVFAGLVVGCSSSGGASSTDAALTSDGGFALDAPVGADVVLGDAASADAAAPDVAPPMGHLKVGPAAVLFTKVGDAQALALTATDPMGLPATVPVTWSSSRPAEITVDNAGNAVAVVVPGSAVITVSAPGYVSASALIIAAPVVDGAVLVDDAAIVAGPTLVDPMADIAPGALATATIHGIAMPAPGTVLLGRGAKPLGGRVMSAMPAGGDVAVTLELMALDEIFKALKVDAEAPLPEEPLAAGGIKQPQTLATQNFMLGPLECTASLTANLISGSVTPTLHENTTYTVHFNLDDAGWHEATAFMKGTLTGGLSGQLKVMAGFGGKFDCHLKLYEKNIPLPGPVGVLFGFTIPIGLKGDASGAVQTLPVTIGADLTGSATFTVGVSWRESTGPVDVTDFTHMLTFEPKFEPPSGDVPVYLKLGLGFGPYVGLEFGSNQWSTLRVNLVEGALMGRVAAEIGALRTQLGSPTFATTYSGTGTIEIKPGPGIMRAAENLTKKAAAGKVVAFLIGGKSITLPGMATQPVGTLMADQKNIEPGKTVNLTAHLDAKTLHFFGINNVQSVSFYRADPGATDFKLMNTVSASEGQTDFKASWTSTVMDLGEHTFWVGVNTTLLPVIAVEPALDTATVVKVSPSGGGWEGSATISITGTQNDADHMVSVMGMATMQLVSAPGATPNMVTLMGSSLTSSVHKSETFIEHSMHTAMNGCHYSDTTTRTSEFEGQSSDPSQIGAFVQINPTNGLYSILFGFPEIMCMQLTTTVGNSSGGGPSCPDVNTSNTTHDTALIHLDGPNAGGTAGPNPSRLMGTLSYDAPTSVPPLHYEVKWDLSRN